MDDAGRAVLLVARPGDTVLVAVAIHQDGRGADPLLDDIVLLGGPIVGKGDGQHTHRRRRQHADEVGMLALQVGDDGLDRHRLVPFAQPVGIELGIAGVMQGHEVEIGIKAGGAG